MAAATSKLPTRTCSGKVGLSRETSLFLMLLQIPTTSNLTPSAAEAEAQKVDSLVKTRFEEVPAI